MSMRQRGTDVGPPDIPPAVHNEIYGRLLKQSHAVAEEAINRLCRLHDRFPADVSRDAIETLRNCHTHSAHPVATPHGNRRWALRFAMQRELLIRDPEQPRKSRKVVVLDYSCGGMRIRCRSAVAVGAVLVVQDPAWAGRPAFAEVRYCYRAEDGWIAGCEFLRVG